MLKRKITLSAIFAACILCISAVCAFAANPINITVNGSEMIFFDRRPVMENNQVLAPADSILEALGANMQWDEASQTVTGTLGDNTVVLTVGSASAYVNGVQTSLDVCPKLTGGTLMVPVRFVSESLGAQAAWSGETQTVSITADLGRTGALSNVHAKGTKRPVPTEFEKSSEMTSENLVYFPMPESPDAAFKKLTGGTVVMQGDDFINNVRSSQGMPEFGSMDTLEEGGEKFFRLTCTSVPTVTWKMNYRVNLPDDFVFETGDLFVFKASARLVEGGDFDTREGSIGLLLGEGTNSLDGEASNGIGSAWTAINANEWKEIYYGGVLNKEVNDAYDYYLGFEWDKYTQVADLKDLQLVIFKNGTYTLSDLPGNSYPYKGNETDAQWRKDALNRIEQIRKGDISVVVKDANGNVIPEADVSLDMFEHEFLWAADYGSPSDAVTSGLSGLEDDYLNNPERSANRRKAMAENFNSVGVTVHKETYDEADNKLYDASKAVVDWSEANGIGKSIRGHALFWDFGKQELIERYGEKCFDGTPEGEALLKQKITEHIYHVAELFPEIDDIDVTNEDASRTGLGEALQGAKLIYGDDILTDIYAAAREAFPNAKLALTDGYSGVSTDGSMWVNNQKPLLDWAVKNLDFDILGYQGHIGHDVSPENIVNDLNVLKGYGKTIRVTEFDCAIKNDTNLQGNAARDALIAYFACDAVDKIQFWSIQDYTLDSTQRILYNYGASALKPGGVAYQDLVYNKWWTREKGTTGYDGVYSSRGYYGDYTITASIDGCSAKVDVHLGKSDPREVVVVIEDYVYTEPATVYGNSIAGEGGGLVTVNRADTTLPTNENIICSKAVTAVVTQGTAQQGIAGWGGTTGVLLPGYDSVTSTAGAKITASPAEVKFLNMIKNKPLNSGDMGKVFKVTLNYKPYGMSNPVINLGIRSLNGSLLDGGSVVNHPWACADTDYIRIAQGKTGDSGTGVTISGYFVVDDFMTDPLYQIGCISMEVADWGNIPSWGVPDRSPYGIIIDSLTVEDTGWRVKPEETLGYSRGIDALQKIDQFPSMGREYTNNTGEVQDIYAASAAYRPDRAKDNKDTTAAALKTYYSVQPGETIIAYCEPLTDYLYDWGGVWYANEPDQKIKYMIWDKNTLEPLSAAEENMDFANRIRSGRPETPELAKTAARAAS